jgi:hypothetical protein
VSPSKLTQAEYAASLHESDTIQNYRVLNCSLKENYLITRRKLNPGIELLAPYGFRYWRRHKGEQELQVEQPDVTIEELLSEVEEESSSEESDLFAS